MRYLLAVLLSLAVAPVGAATTARLGGLDIIPIGTLAWGTRDNNRIYQISSNTAGQFDFNYFTSSNVVAGLWEWRSSSLTITGNGAVYMDPFTVYTSTWNQGGIAEYYGVKAATGVFTATGNTQYSVTTSSGVSVLAGMVVAPGGILGPHYGDGSKLTGLAAGIITPGTFVTGVIEPFGNIDGSTITTALALKVDQGHPEQVNLSTVTTALAGKLSNTAGVSPGLIDLSTVTTALAGKLSNTAGVSPSLIDLSTVTTAFGAKLSSVTLSASLLGLGSASSPLGVDSSSVAIKSGNKIRNSEIDSTLLTPSAANIAAGTLISGVLLPAGNLTGGPVAASILPSTVAYTSTANTFNAAGGEAVTYGLSAGSMTVTGSLTASSGTFTGSGTSSSISASSNVVLSAGMLVAPAIQVSNGTDGSMLFYKGAGVVSQNNSKLFWDNTNFKMCVNCTSPGANLEVDGLNQTLASNTGMVKFLTTDSGTTDIGGSATFGGDDGAGTVRGFATIKSGKENSSSGDTAGYLVLGTRPSGGNITERMRINSTGAVTMVGAGGLSVTYGLSAGSMTVTNGITASSGTFTQTGNTSYSLATSSGISVASPGLVVASAGFVGPLSGNAKTATALASTPTKAPSGSVCIGIDTAGNCLTGGLDATTFGTSASTLPFRSDAAFTSFNQKLSTVTPNGSLLGQGTLASLLGVDSSSVVVKTNNLIRNSEHDSSSVTLQGNTFNGNNQLVQLNSSGQFPAIDGHLITNLPSTAGGAVLASTQNFSGSNTFAGVGKTTTTFQNFTTIAAGATSFVDPSANANYCIWIASQDTTGASRMQWTFANWPGMGWSTATYRYEWYGVTGSSTSNMFANMNCATGGDNAAGRYTFVNSCENVANTILGCSQGAAAFSLPISSDMQNTQHTQSNSGFHGTAEFFAGVSTDTVRQKPTGGSWSDQGDSASTPITMTFGGGYYRKIGTPYSSQCFDWSSGYYNASIDRTRSPVMFHMDVYRCPKTGG